MSNQQTGFNEWVKEGRAKIVQENPKLTNSEVTEKVGAAWTNMDPKEKAVYEAAAKNAPKK